MRDETIRMIHCVKGAIHAELGAIQAVKDAQRAATKAAHTRSMQMAALSGALIGERLEDPEDVWDRLIARNDWPTAAAWAGIQGQDPKAPSHWKDRERMVLHQPRG